MTTEQTSGRPGGAVAEVKEKGEELVSSTQEQLSTKAHELGEDVSFQVREQLDQRSTQAGEQVQAMGHALQSGVEQLRREGKDVPAKVMRSWLSVPMILAHICSPPRRTRCSRISSALPDAVRG